MINNKLEILELINERNYVLLIHNDSPTNDIKEFCFRILKIVGNIEDQAMQQKLALKQQEETNKNDEEVKDEISG